MGFETDALVVLLVGILGRMCASIAAVSEWVSEWVSASYHIIIRWLITLRVFLFFFWYCSTHLLIMPLLSHASFVECHLGLNSWALPHQDTYCGSRLVCCGIQVRYSYSDSYCCVYRWNDWSSVVRSEWIDRLDGKWACSCWWCMQQYSRHR
jgi:hypothetical protein